MNTENSTLIKLDKSDMTMFPNAIVEAKLSVTPNQLDIIALLLAEIAKPTDIDANLDYILTAKDYASLKGYDNEVVAYKVLKEKVIGEPNKSRSSMRHIGFELYLGGEVFEQYNWFSKVRYDNGKLTLTLTPQIKQFLVEFKKLDKLKVFAKLRYILPMNSVYSKRIYLMCREFTESGSRFCDTDWQLFLDKLSISSTYRYAHIKSQILEKALEEINEMSDIKISYNITEKKVQGGKQPQSITFTIKEKTDAQLKKLSDEKN